MPRPSRRLETLEARHLLAAEPLISEWMADNESTLEDGRGQTSDWIELFNAGDESLDLNGWSLTDDPQRLQKWTFPSAMLRPGEFLAVFASGQTYPSGRDVDGRLHASFRLNANGEYLALVDPQAKIRQELAPRFPPQQPDISYGFATELRDQTLVGAGTAVQILIPDSASVAEAWAEIDFLPDGSWLSETAEAPAPTLPVGYGTSPQYEAWLETRLGSMQGRASTVYLRVPFELDDPAAIDRLWLDLRLDDGAVVYLNGQEVARINAQGEPPGPDSVATARRDATEPPLSIDLDSARSLLQRGNNVLAIHALNVNEADDDLFVWPELFASTYVLDRDRVGYFEFPTPGEASDRVFSAVTTEPVQISEPDQTFSGELLISLTTAATAATIHYTLDGSLPGVESPLYEGPFALSRSAQLRARAIQPDAVAGPITARSYVRLAPELSDVRSMLPIAVIDNFGAGRVPNAGWNQTNARIRQVPRQNVSLMLFEPQSDESSLTALPQRVSRAGLRVRGAFSSSFPEPGYSLELWNDANDEDTSQSLFGMEAAADWVLYAPNPQHDQTLIDNTFMFQLQRQMGHWAPDFQYVELYLNDDGNELSADDYVGLYVFVERAERGPGRIDIPRFEPDGSAGGWILEINRMDSITEDGQLPKNFHTAGPDGIQQTPRDLSNASSRGDDIPRQYNAYINFEHPNPRQITEPQRTAIEGWFQTMEDVLYGRVPGVTWNDPVNGYAKYIDVESFIDYLILNNLSHNGDGLLLSMWLYNPDPAGKGRLTFGPIWDVDLGSFSGSATAELMRNTDRLWYGRLFDDPDFAQRYIDRWHELRSDVLTDANMSQIIDSLHTSIGDAAADRDGVRNWSGRLNSMKTWLSRRAAAIDQSAPAIPRFTPAGPVVPFGTPLTIVPTSGAVYFTTDGSDPRQPGGGISPVAQRLDVTQPLSLFEPLLLTARTRGNRSWSPLTQVAYAVDPPDRDDLNQDGRIDLVDLRLIYQAVAGADLRFDRTGDGRTTLDDVEDLLRSAWNTTFGDANFDGRFDSSDIVMVFISGHFESTRNATWAQGDWDGDHRFSTDDFVLAFSRNHYEGEFPAAEPSSPGNEQLRSLDLAFAALNDREERFQTTRRGN